MCFGWDAQTCHPSHWGIPGKIRRKDWSIHILWTKHEALNTFIFNLFAIKIKGILSTLEGKQPCNAEMDLDWAAKLFFTVYILKIEMAFLNGGRFILSIWTNSSTQEMFNCSTMVKQINWSSFFFFSFRKSLFWLKKRKHKVNLYGIKKGRANNLHAIGTRKTCSTKLNK